MATSIPALDLFVTFTKIGLYSFGSATSEVILEQVVEKKAWLSKERFLESLSLAALVPGPFHVNLVGMTGFSVAGPAGGLVSVAAFVLPGFTLSLLIAALLAQAPVRDFLHANPGVIAGMLVAAAGLLLNAVVSLGKSALPKPAYWVPVGLLAAAVGYFHIHFAAAILTAGGLYALAARRTNRDAK